MANPEDTVNPSGESVELPANEWRQVVGILRELRRRKNDERLSNDRLNALLEEEIAKLPEKNERLIKALREEYQASVGQLVDDESDAEEAEEADQDADSDPDVRLQRIQSGLRANLAGRLASQNDIDYFESKIAELKPGEKWGWIMTKINRLPLREGGQPVPVETSEARVNKLKTSLESSLALRDKTKVDSQTIDEITRRIKSLQPEDNWTGILDDIVKLPLAADPANALGKESVRGPATDAKKDVSLLEKAIADMTESEYAEYEKWFDSLSSTEQQAELAKRKGQTQGRSEDPKNGVKKRARKKIRLDKRLDGGEKDKEDVIPSGTQKRLLEVLEKRRKDGKITEEKAQKLVEGINSATKKSELIAIESEISPDQGKNKKEGEKPDEGKRKELLDAAPSDRARKKLDQILRRWDEKERDPSKAASYVDWLRSQMDGTERWQDKERAYVRMNLPSKVEVKPKVGESFPPESGRTRFERIPQEDGRVLIRITKPDGTVEERLEGESRAHLETRLHSNRAPDEMDTATQDQWIHNVRDEGATITPVPAVLPRRSVYQWFKDFISGTDSRVPTIAEPTPQELLHAALNDPSLTEAQRVDRAMMHQLSLNAERTARDGNERGLSGRMARVGEYLKRFGHGAIFGMGAAVAISVAATALFSTGGVALPSLAVLAGAAMGNGSREFSRRYFEVNNYKHPKIYSAMIGAVMGLGTTMIADQVFSAFTHTPTHTHTPTPTSGSSSPVSGIAGHGPNVIPTTPSGSYSWLSQYTVHAGDPVARFGLDGFINSQMMNTPLFQSYHFSTLGHDQFIEAVRSVFTDNPELARQFTGATGRIIEGADGLDLMFKSKDVLDPSVFKSSKFLDCLFKEIRGGGYRELVNNLGGPHGLASFVSKLKP